jgi:hypothetical protein
LASPRSSTNVDFGELHLLFPLRKLDGAREKGGKEMGKEKHMDPGVGTELLILTCILRSGEVKIQVTSTSRRWFAWANLGGGSKD